MMNKAHEQEFSPEKPNTPQGQQPLTGRVAAILNERELVINIGADKGVALQMVFKVVAEKPLEIADPETKEIIGYVDQEKVRVKVEEVQKGLAICKTIRLSAEETSRKNYFASLQLSPSNLEDMAVQVGDRVVWVSSALAPVPAVPF